MPESQAEITEMLRRWSAGDPDALNELVPVVYKELRRLARYHLQRERDGHTLQSAALVHEVYLRLCGSEHLQWQNRVHFFAVAARTMRRVLVDYARRQGANKRGGSVIRATFDETLVIGMQDGQTDLVALDDAMEQLQIFDERKARVVEMRFFAGLSAKEIAAVLGTTEATVRRDWIIAKAWLFRYLERKAEG